MNSPQMRAIFVVSSMRRMIPGNVGIEERIVSPDAIRSRYSRCRGDGFQHLYINCFDSKPASKVLPRVRMTGRRHTFRTSFWQAFCSRENFNLAQNWISFAKACAGECAGFCLCSVRTALSRSWGTRVIPSDSSWASTSWVNCRKSLRE